MRKSTKRIATVAAGAVLLTSTGIAFAYWTTDGTGESDATTAAGNLAAFSVTGDVASAMYPGDSAQTITATVTNDGSENYKLQELVAYVRTNKAGCDGSNFLINGQAAPSSEVTAVDLDITPVDLAPDATQTKTFTIQFNNKVDIPAVEGAEPVGAVSGNQDACKGADVTVEYIAS